MKKYHKFLSKFFWLNLENKYRIGHKLVLNKKKYFVKQKKTKLSININGN